MRGWFGVAFAATILGTIAASAQSLVINEVDYDQFGNDTAEFIELRNNSAATLPLTNLAVVLIDGTTGAEYARFDLTPLGNVPRAGFVVVRTAAVVVPAGTRALEFALPANNIQNGAPDGIALINTATGTLLDSLSYEGAMTAVLIDGLPGVLNLVHGTPLPIDLADVNGPPMSLARIPDGRASGNDLLDWQLVNNPTPGMPNSGGITNCGTSDFDGDGDSGTDRDIEAFFRCLAGNCCGGCWMLGADFNADGDSGTDADIEAFFRVLAGNPC